jgi:hypothetical protein
MIHRSAISSPWPFRWQKNTSAYTRTNPRGETESSTTPEPVVRHHLKVILGQIR